MAIQCLSPPFKENPLSKSSLLERVFQKQNDFSGTTGVEPALNPQFP